MRMKFFLKSIGKECKGNGKSEDLVVIKRSKEYVIW